MNTLKINDERNKKYFSKYRGKLTISSNYSTLGDGKNKQEWKAN